MSRRPSISVNNYPEHLNPFYENYSTYQPIKESSDNKENADSIKETKHKFWTFGKSRKKRSGSFSIKATWNEIFGKNKNTNAFADRRVGVTAGSTSHKNELNGRPYASSRFTHRDQVEFDEAIGTLARRRKYTYDSTTRPYGNATVNDLPRNINNEIPPDGSAAPPLDATPKPPARSRFGQVSPRPTDKIPGLCYEDKDENRTESKVDQIPTPPKRNGLRASQRLIPPQPAERRDLHKRIPVEANTTKDANENLPEDYYVFKRCHQDPVRMSNLSISSCISVTSTTSAYTRKKRRAPPPPRPKDTVITKENEVREVCETSKVEVKIIEPNKELEENTKVDVVETKSNTIDSESVLDTSKEIISLTEKIQQLDSASDVECQENKENNDSAKLNNDSCEHPTETSVQKSEAETEIRVVESSTVDNEAIKTSSDSIDSNIFYVKDEIEKIELQIKELEAKRAYDNKQELEMSRKSIEENRKMFFKNLVNAEENGVDVQLKELPREQSKCEIIHLDEASVEMENNESVKVIEVHITEPIKHRPEIVTSPLPRTRRSSSFSLEKQKSLDMDLTVCKGSKLSL